MEAIPCIHCAATLSIANPLTWWTTPDIQSLTRAVFPPLRQIPSLEIAGDESLAHDVWRRVTLRKPRAPSYLFDSIFPRLSPHFSLSSAAPVSREAVELPVAASCVGGGGEAAMCAPPSGHHHHCGHHYLGSVQPGKTGLTCSVLRECHYILCYFWLCYTS